MNLLLRLFFCFVLTLPITLQAQSPGQNKKERKHIRKKWKKSNQSYNPYLDKKAKNKPSAKMARADQKEMKKQKRRAKKQMRRSKRNLK